MSNKLLAATLLILLVVIAVVLYNKSSEEEEPVMADVALSFICQNEQHFVAEFDINFETLAVVENGEVTRELQRSNTTTMSFADNNFEYTFAGEGVRVLNKSTSEEALCNQPFDPNNAPYNFGDLGEGEGQEQDATEAVNENIVGKWVSLDDEKFTREFRSDGTAIDSYEDEEVSEGEWLVFTYESGIATEFPQDPESTYIQIKDADPQGVLYFSLAKLTPEELELIYMDRGNVLRFSRANTISD